MRVEFVNPFIEAAQRVIRAETQSEVRRGALSLNSSPYTTRDVTVLVAVTGRVQGTVLYSMPEETARAIVSAMIGQPFDKMNDLAVSGIAELGNVITGTASTALAEAGFPSRIAPPIVLIGSGTQISTVDIQRLVVPLSTQLGPVEIQVALKEVLSNGWSSKAPAESVRI